MKLRLFRSPIFRFFSSLKLAVFSILTLASVLATATFMESYYGMRAAHVMIYGTSWFAGILFMLGLNVFCAALSRYPWKRHQTGFVITHLGIITLLVGSVVTQRLGVDGNLPIVENSQSNQVLMNDLALIVTDEAGIIKREIPVPETGKADKGRLVEISFSDNDRLVLDCFLPRVIPETTVVRSPAGSGVPAIRVELFNDRFQVEQWMFNQNPDRPSELSLGPAILSFQRLWNAEEERKFFQPEPKTKESKKSVGYILLSRKGREYRIDVEKARGKWAGIEGSDLRLRVDRYLPYAIVKGKDLISRSPEPINPAVQLTLSGPNGEMEKHTLFAKFPEFNTLHERNRDQSKPKLEVKFRLISSAAGEGENAEESLGMVGTRRGRLKFALGSDNKKILYKVFSSKGDMTGKGEAIVGKANPTGWMNLQFRVAESFDHAVQQTIPRYVEYISGGESNFLTAIHYRREEKPKRATASGSDGQSAADGGHWLIEGSSSSVAVGDERFILQLSKNRLSLPFNIFLNKFTIGMDPGTTKAASYSSQVSVKDTGQAGENSSLISMNEPLKYGGFTFYQASYQLEDGRPPVSVLSVNYDPGRMIKYAGALIIVLGALLMFYMNPHYWNKLFGGK